MRHFVAKYIYSASLHEYNIGPLLDRCPTVYECITLIEIPFIALLHIQDDFAHLRPLCYPQVDVAIVCFSVVNMISYENAKNKWVKEIRRHCPGVPLIIVGTQVDKRENPAVLKELKSQGKRTVSRSDGKKLVSQCKATCYVECSALTQFNVKGAFDEAIAAALELNTRSSKHSAQCTAGCTIL